MTSTMAKTNHPPDPSAGGPDGREPLARVPARGGRNAWLLAKVFLARLRFLAIVAAVGAAILYWDTLTQYWNKWTRPAHAHAGAGSDAEYFCPMHPQVVREHPDKCPICFMPLSKRQKADGDGPVPAGGVRRVQLSPYRVALAGVQTSEVAYQHLTKAIKTVGFVEFDERKEKHIAARVEGRIDKLYVDVTGQTVDPGEKLALLYSPKLVVTVEQLLDAQRAGKRDYVALARERLRLWGIDDQQIDDIVRASKANTHLVIRAPIHGHVIRKYQVEGKYVQEGTPLYDVADLSTVWIQAQVYEDELALLKEGLPVSATTPAFPGRVFTGKVAFIHPHLDRASRTLTVRFDMDNPDHDLRPGMYATVTLQVPLAQVDVFGRVLVEDWRDETAFAGLPAVLGAAAGPQPAAGLGPLLRAAVRQALLRQGQVLAVPESAVIDTGSRKVVYREVAAGVYEGVEVQLGPRNGFVYPVLRGLAAGERVVTAGSFLIDAETRLNPAAGSTYFGSTGAKADRAAAPPPARPSASGDEDATVKDNRARLGPEDRQLVEAQEFCAVQRGNRLGSMGVPIKVLVAGQPVFLCCEGCQEQALAHPEKTLARVKELKARIAEKGR
jgi:Cu(I)/Ag(I) efflux system membrane fusion protein